MDQNKNTVDRFMKLFDFQKSGVEQLQGILADRHAAILGDDMGLGKTFQALAVAIDKKKNLVLCPASVVGAWETAIEEFFDETPKVDTVLNEKHKINQKAQFVLCSYAMAIRMPVLGQLIHQQEPWDLIIYDEAHTALGNKESLRCRMCLGNLPKVSERQLFLTGSLTQNKIINLWPMYRYCGPEIIGSYWNFAREFCFVEETPFGKKVKGGRRLDQLKEKSRKFLIRRKKEDVLPELPARLEKKVYIQSEAVDLKIHERAVLDFFGHEDDFDEPPEQVSTIARELGYAKVPAVVEYLIDLQESEEQPIVVFCNHKEVFGQICLQLRAAGFEVGGISGDTPQRERTNIVKEFQDGKLNFFVGTSAAAEGITLHRSNIFVSAEMYWSLSKNEQAIDRLHRIGQKLPVYVHWLICRGTIDEAFYQSYKRKKRLKEKAVN